MPFGLINAPAVFQSLVNYILWDFINWCAFIYLDNILMFFHSPQEHEIQVHQIPQWLLESKLCIKVEKSEFHVPSVSFLGYILERGQVKAEPEKTQAMVEWPVPEFHKQLQ